MSGLRQMASATWAFLSKDTLWSAVAAIAALAAVYQVASISREERASARPYIKLVGPGFRGLTTGSPPYRMTFDMVNIGVRPAVESEGRLIMIDQTFAGSPLRDVPLSVGNDMPPDSPIKWLDDTFVFPTELQPHWVIVALSYRDPVLNELLDQIFVMKWKGAINGLPAPDFEYATRAERSLVLDRLKDELGRFH